MSTFDFQPIIDVAKASVQLPPVQMVDGRPYTTESLKLIEAPLPPVVPTIVVTSLQAVVDFCDGFTAPEASFLLVGTNSVQLFGTPAERSQIRPVLIKATSEGTWKSGYCDHWLPQVDFLIWAQQSFAMQGDLAEVLTLAKNVKAEKIVEATDDGFSQTVAVRRGGGMKYENLKPVYSLHPYRSFPEIPPLPMSFLMRKQDSDDASKPPSFGLFNADSGQWDVAMRSAIKAFLQEHIKDLPILA